MVTSPKSIMIFLLVLFLSAIGCCMVNFGQLLRGQPHSFDFNLRVFSIFDQTFIGSLVTRLAPKSNPSALQGMKGYWPIFKLFYSGIEIPLISPLIINNRAITNFIEKGNFFNIVFALQYTPIVNGKELASASQYRTSNRLKKLVLSANNKVN